MIRGHLDGVVHGDVCGWASRVNQPDQLDLPVSLSICVDGELVAHVEAREFRADLARLGISSGYCGFRYPVSELIALTAGGVLDGKDHVVEVFYSDLEGDGEEGVLDFSRVQLPGSPQLITFGINGVSENSVPPSVQESIKKVWGDLHLIAESNKKIAIFSTFTDGDGYLGYHSKMFQALKNLGFFVLAIHTSNAPTRFRPDGFCNASVQPDITIVRSNVGYDFGSYMLGLNIVYRFNRTDSDVLLVNDSSFGPLHSLEAVFDKMSREEYDFWGIVDSYEHVYHLQSFFLLFTPKVLNSSVFRDYVECYGYPSEKSQVIEGGELKITPLLFRAGFRGGLLLSIQKLFRAG